MVEVCKCLKIMKFENF